MGTRVHFLQSVRLEGNMHNNMETSADDGKLSKDKLVLEARHKCTNNIMVLKCFIAQ